jgi:hypothetical protein
VTRIAAGSLGPARRPLPRSHSAKWISACSRSAVPRERPRGRRAAQQRDEFAPPDVEDGLLVCSRPTAPACHRNGRRVLRTDLNCSECVFFSFKPQAPGRDRRRRCRTVGSATTARGRTFRRDRNTGDPYLAPSAWCEPLSGSPALAVRDSAASSLTFARIGPKGPNLCCSAGKPSA